MIRLARCTQASKAGHYFRVHLATGDNAKNPASPSVPFRASWVGPALPDLSLAAFAQPSASHLTRLGRGLHPTKNERLAPSKNRKRAYYDLTIAAPKTISLATLLDPNHPTARNVLHAHQSAVEAVGRAVGTMLEPARKASPKVVKWVGAIFHHTHKREGDPHLHSHVILPNVMRNERGEWRAMQVNIAGINRTRLELIYGHELARRLRQIGSGSQIMMRSNGVPELKPVRKLVPRFSKATAAVLRAAKRSEEVERADAAKANDEEKVLHSRSRLPVPPDRAKMRRRAKLADELRKPKARDADNPVRLTDEGVRWMRALSNPEARSLLQMLDDLDITNPRYRVRVHSKLAPPAAIIVRVAYQLLPPDMKPTAPLLMRAAVRQSAGRHGYEELRLACNTSLHKRRENAKRILAEFNAEADALAYAALHAGRPTLPGPQVWPSTTNELVAVPLPSPATIPRARPATTAESPRR